MNRILQRPMFRIGGSAGTGITSGLDQPRAQYASGTDPYDTFEKKIKELNDAFERYKEMGGTLSYDEFKKEFAAENFNTGGRVGYKQGSTPNFQMGGLPGFLTGFGLNLLATPPQGNIFQTAATAARDPFNRLQASQAEAMKTASDRAFARELAEEERDFLSGETTRKLESAERIAAMDTGNLDKRLEAAREDFGDDIKAARAVDFADNKFKEFEDRFGEGQVATTVIDSDNYQRKGSLEKFVKQNPRIAGLKIYDVATNKPVVIVTDTETGRLKLVPADSADIDTTGEGMPDPNIKPGLFGQPTKPEKELKEVLPDFRDTGFDEDFYQS